LEKQLYDNIFIPGNRTSITQKEILDTLNKIKEILIYQHNGLFLHLINSLINKVHVFGLHFASLDIRQESSVHNIVLEEIAAAGKILPAEYAELSIEKKIAFLANNKEAIPDLAYKNPIVNDTINTIKAIKLIQDTNGESGCNRYIISQCNSALNVFEVYGLFILCGWKEKINIDIVPLFETIDDLQNAATILKTLYENEEYNKHLKRRNKCQTIMLGFSDGTKDGLFYGNPTLLFTQLKGLAIVVAYSFITSFIIFKIINFIQPIRVSSADEELGLDASQHNEKYLQGTLLVKNSNGITQEEKGRKKF
jgi:phosphoenolpyruvate carboxylase